MSEPGSESAPRPELTNTYQERRQAVMSILGDPGLKQKEYQAFRGNYWTDDLHNNFDEAVARGRKWGNSTARVLQFADGPLSMGKDFIDDYFGRFGAHVQTRNQGRINLDVNNLEGLLMDTNSTGLRTVTVEKGSFMEIGKIPEGSYLVVEPDGSTRYLIAETDIDGVRFMMDGSAVYHWKQRGINYKSVRPMLLVRIDDAKETDIAKLPPDPEDLKKTWNEIHGREPNQPGGPVLRHEHRSAVRLASEGDYAEKLVARAMMAWQAEAKRGNEIKVTPTKLKENPVLGTEEDRKEVLERALTMALKNMKADERRQGRPVVGATTYALAIIVEVLKMTAEEIEKDAEAMSDLVEYLKQAAYRRNPSVGPSAILGPSDNPNDLFEHTAKQIEGTWEFPEWQGLQQPFMYQRISWTRNSPPKE